MLRMGKANCYRWEIWMCKLEKYELMNHFCVIVSNFKMNNKHKSIHACLITSKLNSFKSRVDIELFEPSQVCCETILTLPKTDLLYKLTDIKDILTQLEIEKNLEIQLQLSNNFINTDIEQMENYLKEGVYRMNNEGDLVNLKNSICNLALENKYEESIILCNKLIELTQASNLECKSVYLWHSYYHRSLMFTKLEQYQISLEDARESLKYVPSLRSGMSNLYSYSSWLIAKNLENLNDTDGAKRMYSNLCKYYKKVGKTSMRITMLYNLCIINKDINRMKILIDMLEKINYRELETEKNKEELLKQMKIDLLNMQ
jgi:tetratricopeptide (TPR) repeat protein